MPRDTSSFDWNDVAISKDEGDDVRLTPGKWMGNGRRPHFDLQIHSDIKQVATVTGNLEKALSHWISNADFVFCCFAWLTNYRVLDALASLKHGCQVVVQKEDFLRPDSDHTSRSHKILREKYEKLRCRFARIDLPSIAGQLSVCSSDLVEPVRCAGVSNSDRRKAAPRMHHKFAVACKTTLEAAEERCDPYVNFHPYSVWTGSFNPTSNGTRSRENAVIIDSESVANYYVDEWAKVFAVSERLNWRHEWSMPEWRIGT